MKECDVEGVEPCTLCELKATVDIHQHPNPEFKVLVPVVLARALRGFEESFIVVDVEHPEGKWRTALSGVAWGIYEAIRESPEDATARIEEWASEFKTSKTRIRQALRELEDHGFITAYVEENE